MLSTGDTNTNLELMFERYSNFGGRTRGGTRQERLAHLDQSKFSKLLKNCHLIDGTKLQSVEVATIWAKVMALCIENSWNTLDGW